MTTAAIFPSLAYKPYIHSEFLKWRSSTQLMQDKIHYPCLGKVKLVWHQEIRPLQAETASYLPCGNDPSARYTLQSSLFQRNIIPSDFKEEDFGGFNSYCFKKWYYSN